MQAITIGMATRLGILDLQWRQRLTQLLWHFNILLNRRTLRVKGSSLQQLFP